MGDLTASRESLEAELPRRAIPAGAVRLIEQPPALVDLTKVEVLDEPSGGGGDDR